MAKPNAEAIFRAKAPAIMAKLMADFPISIEDAAAIMGNLGHESAGLAILQEISPTVQGSRGGFGWAQWTGPRRRAFEAYCKRNNLDPASDKANYAYLFLELRGIEGTEAGAIAKTKAAVGLDAKVVAFERAFLRAGVKHYDSRQQWAKIAMDAWQRHEAQSTPKPRPMPIPVDPMPPPKPSGINPAGVIIALVILAALAAAFFLRIF